MGWYVPRDGNAMDIESCKSEVISLDEAIHVDQPQDEALIAAARVLENAVQVPGKK